MLLDPYTLLSGHWHTIGLTCMVQLFGFLESHIERSYCILFWLICSANMMY